MGAFTDLERKILVCLEAAGPDDLSALLNSVLHGTGNLDEIERFRIAFAGLMDQDLLRLARSRTSALTGIKPLSHSESVAVLPHLRSLLQWSAPERIWRWNVEARIRMDAVLTDAGMAAARRIAAEE